MGKLRHIAISVPDPWKAAEFFMNAFGLEKVGEHDSELARGVFLSDGTINLALLNYKTDEAAGEEHGKDFVGLHHIGFWVDDIKKSRKQVEAAGGKYFMGEVPEKGNSFYEIKYRDPLNMIFDISAHGWGGASKHGKPAPRSKPKAKKRRARKR